MWTIGYHSILVLQKEDDWIAATSQKERRDGPKIIVATEPNDNYSCHHAELQRVSRGRGRHGGACLPCLIFWVCRHGREYYHPSRNDARRHRALARRRRPTTF